MARRSRPAQIEFTVTAPDDVVDAIESLVEARAGWVNLFPEVDQDEAAAVTPSAVASLFRAPGPPIPQATIIAPTDGRRGPKPAQLGMTHGVGTAVVRRLAAEGLELPGEWKVVQDHVRRGLVVRLDDPPDAEQVLTWALRAGTLLCPIATTGGWLAEIHR
ncbi:MAG TPA: hypothetical protein VFU19_09275 [Iamia sp.]|nr:hypothetical protein [Iamia sp.]